jgi:peptidylprolyl isomerase
VSDCLAARRGWHPNGKERMKAAQAGDTVHIHYTGRLDDGQVFDSSEGGDPLEFTVGAGQVIPGFDQAVQGMAEGEEKRVTIPAEEAYGPHREEMVLTVERGELPEGVDPEVGQQYQMSQAGQTFVVTVTDVTEAAIELDANHPLAGRDLTFDLQLVGVGGA